jgi:hypothetical protein
VGGTETAVGSQWAAAAMIGHTWPGWGLKPVFGSGLGNRVMEEAGLTGLANVLTRPRGRKQEKMSGLS